MIIGYIRVSKISQDLHNQKNAIYDYANSHKLFVDEFVEIVISSRKNKKQRKIDELLTKLNRGDMLVITELSRLGRSITGVVGIVNTLIEEGIRLISIKENIDLKDHHSIQSKVMITMFSLFAELERDLISQRTKEALNARRAAGVKLGRPKGPGKSKLDIHKEQIQELLNKEVSVASISKILEVSYPTVLKYIRKRKLEKQNTTIV